MSSVYRCKNCGGCVEIFVPTTNSWYALTVKCECGKNLVVYASRDASGTARVDFRKDARALEKVSGLEAAVLTRAGKTKRADFRKDTRALPTHDLRPPIGLTKK